MGKGADMKKQRDGSRYCRLHPFSYVCRRRGLFFRLRPRAITVDDTTKATNRYLGVGFSHSKHVAEVGLTCVMCHHTEDKDFVLRDAGPVRGVPQGRGRYQLQGRYASALCVMPYQEGQGGCRRRRRKYPGRLRRGGADPVPRLSPAASIINVAFFRIPCV